MRQFTINLGGAASGSSGLAVPLAMDIGGTGSSLGPVPGAIVWTDANSMEISAVGLSGQYLSSQGALSPAWVTPAPGFSLMLPVPMNLGGTGQSLGAIAGGMVYSDANSMEVLAAGLSGRYLTSQGAGAPLWADLPLGFSLQLPVPMNLGGTGQSLAASAGAIVYTDSNSMEVGAAGLSGQFLSSQGTSAPAWANLPLGFSLQLPVPMNLGGTGQSLAASAGAIVYTDANSMEVSAVGTSGQYLTSQAAGAPIWTTFVTPALNRSVASAAYSLTTTDNVVLLGGSASFALTLCSVSLVANRIFNFKNTRSGVNAVTFNTTAPELVDGTSFAFSVIQYESLSFFADGTSLCWYRM